MINRPNEGDSTSKSSKAGQLIGNVFESLVIRFIGDHIAQNHTDYELLEPEKGGKLVKLEMFGGTSRQLDTVVVAKNSEEPVALLETKWLKDARHHNDKGAWILQLREVRNKYPTVRGAAAILAGYWTEGVGVLFMSDANIRMVLVATDDEVYSTLQKPLDVFLGENSFTLDAKKMRQRYEKPADFARFLNHLVDLGKLNEIAAEWLNFERGKDTDGYPITGGDQIKRAIDELLQPLPEHPSVQSLEIALQIDTGNTIYEKFDDFESALEFIQTYYKDSKAILKKITPKKKGK